MPTDKDQLDIPEIGTSRDNPYRRSLQPKGTTDNPILRLTQSQNYKKKKKVQVPPIPENEESTEEKKQEKEVKITVDVMNEQVKMPRGSKTSRKGSQASKLGIDNAAFEIEDGGRIISRGNSAASSVRSSMRDPSVQSLTVVREQYCCCTRWTPCERALFAAVCVLSFIIIILIVTVVLVAVEPSDDGDEEPRVVRQQYWCCSRWTPFERNLCIAVVFLTLTIVALLLAVGLLASRGSDKHENHNGTTTISSTLYLFE